MAAITYKLITGINIQKQMFSSKDLYDYLQVNLVFMCVCACVCVCVCVCVCWLMAVKNRKKNSANNNIHCIQINHFRF